MVRPEKPEPVPDHDVADACRNLQHLDSDAPPNSNVLEQFLLMQQARIEQHTNEISDIRLTLKAELGQAVTELASNGFSARAEQFLVSQFRQFRQDLARVHAIRQSMDIMANDICKQVIMNDERRVTVFTDFTMFVWCKSCLFGLCGSILLGIGIFSFLRHDKLSVGDVVMISSGGFMLLFILIQVLMVLRGTHLIRSNAFKLLAPSMHELRQV